MQRIGIVGGGIRGHMYAHSLQGFPGADVRAVCDLSAEVARETADAFGLAAYTDHRRMLAEAELDAVIVATPDHAHRAAAVDAAAHGLHLLLEKPLATTAEDADAIADAVREAGVECMVGFENRWNPAIRKIHDLAAGGELGQVLTQNILLSNTWYVPTRMLSWAAKSSPAWFLMSHTVDAAMWVNGRTVTAVDARGSRGRLAARGVDTWDVIHALLTFDDGTTANLTSTWVLPDSMPSIVDFQYQAVGDRSAVTVDLQDQSVRHAAADGYRFPGLLGGEIDGRLQGPPTWMAQHFVAQLEAGEPVGPGPATGRAVTDVVLAVHESLETGRTVAPRRPTDD
ncbi:Gfo/Idh/MocA family oxidoreductase [Streptomyces axinellae]|uniref:Gfo/Idh/MocA family oxidoreductase n=1 Tax=Streptomyces axinellae TaxID=552788 RepID=A0ABN3QGS5_9ACTN